MADAVGVVPDEGGRVDAADQQVAAVEAPRHVGVRERLLDVRGGLRQRADVRVQDELQALRRGEVRDLAQVRAHALPPGLVEGRGRRPVEVGDERRHEHVGAGRRELGRGTPGLLTRVAELGLVHDDRHEAADEPQPVAVELGPGQRAVERQPAQRTQLGGRDPERPHLREHAIRRQLQAPARDLADPP